MALYLIQSVTGIVVLPPQELQRQVRLMLWQEGGEEGEEEGEREREGVSPVQETFIPITFGNCNCKVQKLACRFSK